MIFMHLTVNHFIHLAPQISYLTGCLFLLFLAGHPYLPDLLTL